MASSNTIEDGSDLLCDVRCNLKYGVSQKFSQFISERQKLKSFRTNIKMKIFDDENEQEKYCHMMSDEIYEIFDGQYEKKIFRKALDGMNTNYKEILLGREKFMFYCPTAFNFDSRVGPETTSVPDALENMETSLISKGNLNKEEKSNLTHISEKCLVYGLYLS